MCRLLYRLMGKKDQMTMSVGNNYAKGCAGDGEAVDITTPVSSSIKHNSESLQLFCRIFP